MPFQLSNKIAEAVVQFPALAAVAILQWLNPLVFHQQQMVLCQLWQKSKIHYTLVHIRHLNFTISLIPEHIHCARQQNVMIIIQTLKATYSDQDSHLIQ